MLGKCATLGQLHSGDTSSVSITIPPSLSTHQVWWGEEGEGDRGEGRRKPASTPTSPDKSRCIAGLLSTTGQWWLFPTHLPRMFSRIPECSDQLTHSHTHRAECLSPHSVIGRVFTGDNHLQTLASNSSLCSCLRNICCRGEVWRTFIRVESGSLLEGRKRRGSLTGDPTGSRGANVCV